MTDLTVKVATSLTAVPAEAWNACAHAAPADGSDARNPFVSHAFLSSLEDSACVGGRSGWAPAHVLVENAEGVLVAAAPCYVKSHSQGEYVFDHGWADAYERAGGRYYPKLQVSVPFTPATGPRLMVRDGVDRLRAEAALAGGLRQLCAQLGASSAHVTFLERGPWERLRSAGFLQRIDQQFHWHNEGFGSFDDFLASLASRKRKMLRRERRDALAAGIIIEWLTGAAITQAHWDVFYDFYQDTGSRKWGRPYLNRKFFSLVGERMGDEILLVMAKRAGRYVAGAINFIGASTLYGRNWGCVEDHPFLHFEVCYYQAMDYAIANGLRVVEAGAQGEHKLMRGYRPIQTHSAHYIADPALRRAVADYLARERDAVAALGDELEDALPFRRGEAD